MNHEQIQMIKCCPIFREVGEAILTNVLTASRCRIRTYVKGERILVQGSRYHELAVMMRGKAYARIYEYSGKTILVETLEAPQPAAAAILFSSDPVMPVTLEAETEVTIAHISRSAVTAIFQVSPKAVEHYLQDMGDKVSFLAEKVRLAEFAGIRQRVADYLLRLRTRHQNDSIILPLSREKLAEMFGAARPSLSREISKMCDEGLISASGRAVNILEPDLLQELLEL